MTACPFLRNKWKELVSGKPADWSWLVYHDPFNKLPTVAELQEKNFPQYWEVALIQAGFMPDEIRLCANRMIMGSMRYKSLSRTTYYDYPYYMKRMSLELKRAKTNLEGIYDGLNIALLAWHSGIITDRLCSIILNQFYEAKQMSKAEFKAEDRTEW
jgi:hypothetical protein